ncbi:YhcN/YlaJ family sporulation lipoprotein [Virgibacillus alimentarius]|uniref:YhcN/YlaJ family sporulation lipoprotein n=1 Tax=Virgibacillus alimentarius TaxID=698769 RepID=A0ABS4S3U3_9BACI|nr:YhcN/YlaJ family sporulation lipoprotein [Virgibacillus alimentarius]MBP2256074.1 YhcN/YlaJ family sporulation lipoprotein [Virgibacillus alimentarius]
MHLRTTLFLLISLLIITGCQKTKDDALPETDNQDRFVQVENTDQEEKNNMSNEQIANHLANVASDVPNVEDAAAVVAGPYAVVGIDVDRKSNRSRVGTIKYSVTEALQQDRYGKTAVVVADADGTERIRGMADKIQQGYPVQGIMDELSAIVGRYMPDFPTNDNKPRDPDQNKDVIPNKDEDKLDEIEEEQSNEHKENK